MPYDNAGYRDHCGDCRHFKLDAERTKRRREAPGNRGLSFVTAGLRFPATVKHLPAETVRNG